MAATLRLYRIGKKGRPAYRIVVVHKRYKADGSYIEEVGKYDPIANPTVFNVKKDRFDYWISRGAIISEGLKKLLKNRKV
ncbi:30S ribosomal protein S16 [Microgenomates bacterium UTCPR1]|nr:30S ribosomal protein S16 [Patescibacteria group bacterium]OQY65200.1 MAG: 30S ribosomal protein S16 [Microgenomates bacterium UTCPR1]